MTEETLIKAAKVIDNDFLDCKKITTERRVGYWCITGYTEGGQCVKCEVRIHTKGDEILRVEIDDDGIREITEWTKTRLKNELNIHIKNSQA